MHNILVFGCRNRITDIRESFAALPSKLIFINSLTGFYSTAFSRVFDLWLVDFGHPEAPDLSLKELITTQKVPFVFLLRPHDSGLADLAGLNPKVVALPDDAPVGDWVARFARLDSDLKARNREQYLAGLIRAKPGIEAIVTQSPRMHQLIDLVKDIAPTESALLLSGKTGTGKELLATILHNESRRRSGPFMAVNCGALPDTLLESELFGYEKGAFTGAVSRRIGKIEHAAGGTLFLDEIESMSEAMQVRLLRVLQEKSLQRLGSNVEIGTDFRLIAATNTEPAELLGSGKLRSDLYYRIAVFPIHIPQLRERAEDIPLLTTHFVCRKRKDGRGYVQGVDAQAMKILCTAPWYGNIRELQNVIERAVMLADNELITAELINIPTFPIPELTPSAEPSDDTAFRPGTTLKSYKSNRAQSAERKYLVGLLEYTNGRIGESAQLAGLTPRALYNKMKIYGLKKEDFKISEQFTPIGKTK